MQVGVGCHVIAFNTNRVKQMKQSHLVSICDLICNKVHRSAVHHFVVDDTDRVLPLQTCRKASWAILLTENACWVACIAAACLNCHLHVPSLQSDLPPPEHESHQAFHCSVCHLADEHSLPHFWRKPVCTRQTHTTCLHVALSDWYRMVQA